MVAIVLLSMAILPVTVLFTTGLNSITKTSGYDQGRALANAQVELAQNLSKTNPAGWTTLTSTGFPVCTGGSGPTSPDSSGRSTATGCTDTNFPGYTFDLTKQFVQFDPSGPTGPSLDKLNIVPSATDQKLIQLTVTVKWQGGPYKTTRMVTQA
jgi:hypothetical protein